MLVENSAFTAGYFTFMSICYLSISQGLQIRMRLLSRVNNQGCAMYRVVEYIAVHSLSVYGSITQHWSQPATQLTGHLRSLMSTFNFQKRRQKRAFLKIELYSLFV